MCLNGIGRDLRTLERNEIRLGHPGHGKRRTGIGHTIGILRRHRLRGTRGNQIRQSRLDFLQAFRCAFGKLVARFNDLNPGVDHIAGNWFGTRDEDGDQARPDRGKPR